MKTGIMTFLGNLFTSAAETLQLGGDLDITDDEATPNTIVHVDETNKRVGIGTDSPSEKLHLGGIVGYARVNCGASTAGFWGGESNAIALSHNTDPNTNNVLDTSLGTARIDLNDGEIQLKTGTTNTAPSTRVTIDSTGNVGIGTDSPGNTLDVGSGSIRIGSLTGSGERNVTATGDGDLQIDTSDARLKTAVEDLTYSTETLKALRPVSYQWKPSSKMNDGGLPHIGFIAQEVESLVPEIVGQHEQLGYRDCRTFSQSSIVPILVKTVQDLITRIEALEAS